MPGSQHPDRSQTGLLNQGVFCVASVLRQMAAAFSVLFSFAKGLSGATLQAHFGPYRLQAHMLRQAALYFIVSEPT